MIHSMQSGKTKNNSITKAKLTKQTVLNYYLELAKKDLFDIIHLTEENLDNDILWETYTNSLEPFVVNQDNQEDTLCQFIPKYKTHDYQMYITGGNFGNH